MRRLIYLFFVVASLALLETKFLFYKGNKKLVPRALLSYISNWKFLRTLEKCEKHSPSARASPHFSRVLKNSRVLI